jgi:hypothetical protein
MKILNSLKASACTKHALAAFKVRALVARACRNAEKLVYNCFEGPSKAAV